MPPVVLDYQGHRLTYEEKRHRYTLDGKSIKSVTHYTGLTSKPNLVWWAARCAVELFQKHLTPGDVVDSFLYDKLSEDMKKEHARQLKESGEFGTAVHKEVEKALAGFDIDNSVTTMALHARSALKWLEENVKDIIYQEKLVFSVEDWYSGKFDIYCELLNGNNAVIDIKTGSGIYPEHHLQTAAYLKAMIEMNLSGPATRYIVRTTMGKAEEKERPWESYDSDFKAFRGLIHYGNWLKEIE